ncbi:MAG: class I SAM-dependent methyltransferase [Candidatus Nanopelagicaceae bacterium]|nr:class I SAM-dependent methyltransferase [Candidatus Nanopelagicaceae bacterium]
MLEGLITCPSCHLLLEENQEELKCGNGHTVQIKDGVVLLVPNESYSSSFGQQWKHFSDTQVDSLNGSELTEKRFFDETGWTRESLKDAVILDAGCGSGRFTEIASRYAKAVISVDLSEAVFAIPPHILAKGNILRIHGDLRDLSLDFSKITHVFSIGVLQHTPEPYDTLRRLVKPMAPGTKFAFTAYARQWYTPLHPKYLIRPITKRLPRKFLLSFLERLLPKIFGFLMALVRPKATRRLFKFLIPVALYPEYKGELSGESLLQFTILDTFDMLTPQYDAPLTSSRTVEVLRPFSSRLDIRSSVPVVVRGERS